MRIDVSSLKSIDRQPFEFTIQAAEPGLDDLTLQVKSLSIMSQLEASSKAATLEALYLKDQADLSLPEDRVEALKLELPDPCFLPDGRRLDQVTGKLLEWACQIHSAQVKAEYMLSEILALMLSDEYGSGFADLLGAVTTGNRGKASPLPLSVAS